MKRVLRYILAVGLLFWFRIPPAAAHYLYLEPQGAIQAAAGQQVTVGVYLHAETDDRIYGWGLAQVFDSIELNRLDFYWGSNPVGSLGEEFYAPVENYWGSNFTFLSRYDMSFQGVALSGGSDYLLFSVTYTFKSGSLDASDVWLDWQVGEDVFWDCDSGYVNTLPNQGTGPDYGTTPKPVKVKAMPWLHLLLDDNQSRVATTLGTTEAAE